MGNETRQQLAHTSARLKQRFDALNRLVEVSVVMNSTLSIKPLLNTIMDAAVEITGSEAASILLVDQNTADLYFAASTSTTGQSLKGIKVPMEGSIAGAIIENDAALIIDDVTKDPRHFQQVDEKIEFITRSILGVPMRIRSKLIGVLEVLNKAEGKYLTEDTQHITILASQAAVAIDNAQMVDELRHANEEIEKISKLKGDFIKVASHELRTPLAVILGYADFLKEDASEETSQHVSALTDAALQMRGLIDAMTNLRYLQLDETELSLKRVAVQPIAKSCIEHVTPEAEKKNQILVFEPPKNPIEVEGDSYMLELALNNVLNNAVSFTPAGGVIILAIDRKGKEVWVSVRDSGIGCPADEVANIFKEFYQVEDPMTRHHGGLGLGLTISKAVIKQHSGRIWAQSPGRGEGMQVTFALPLFGLRHTSELDQQKIKGTRPLI